MDLLLQGHQGATKVMEGIIPMGLTLVHWHQVEVDFLGLQHHPIPLAKLHLMYKNLDTHKFKD